jgi:hypothetical protein
MAVFWVVAPCSVVEVYQSFRGPCCLHHQGDESVVNLLSLNNSNFPLSWKYANRKMIFKLENCMDMFNEQYFVCYYY